MNGRANCAVATLLVALFWGQLVVAQPDVVARYADKTIALLRPGRYTPGRINLPNGDMVGHTGKLEAAVKAAECLDNCLERVAAALSESNSQSAGISSLFLIRRTSLF